MFFEILKNAVAIISSLGAAGAVIFGLSNFFGKLWANRFMEKEKVTFQKDLEEFKSNLQYRFNSQIEEQKRELDLRFQNELRQLRKRGSLYEELSISLEELFAKEDDELSTVLNKMFGLLALYAPDDVYLSLKTSLEGYVVPKDAKPKIYYALRKSIMGDDTKLSEKDFIKHINVYRQED